MGWQDLELYKKLRGSRKWERVPLPTNLPPVDLSSSSRPISDLSDSPPPGRPGHHYSSSKDSYKRGRNSPGNSEDQNNPKAVKLCTEARNVEVDVQEIEKADLVSEGINSPSPHNGGDPGTVISVQGTPAKLQNMALFQQSPIITRVGKKN